MDSKTVLLVDADAASRMFVTQLLQKENFAVLQVGSGREGLIAAWRDRPDVIVIDPALPDLAGEVLIQKLRADARSAQIPCLALSSDPSPARMSACLNNGFNEYIVKSGQAVSQLIQIISTLTGQTRPSPATASRRRKGATQVVFLSAKGGTGTSSLCANIAHCITAAMPEALVAVVDLVLPIGSIASIVGAKNGPNLITLTDMAGEQLNTSYLQENLSKPDVWKFFLVAGAPDPEAANLLRVDRISPVVDALKSSFDYVLIDLGRSLSRFSMPLIEGSDVVSLVLGTDLSTITLTKTVWDYLKAHGVGQESIYPILNRSVGLEGLTKAETEERLGFQIRNTIPYMGGQFALANNQHQPIIQKFPSDTASMVMKQIATEIDQLAQRTRAQ
jgi:MinD-like ATPase involved in chromosome partitioning or flagellar assembly/FixJ family two-component response regulator